MNLTAFNVLSNSPYLPTTVVSSFQWTEAYALAGYRWLSLVSNPASFNLAYKYGQI